MSNIIIQNVRQRHASVNTVYHALYRNYFLGMTRKDISKVYGKSLSTVCEWFKKFETNGFFERKKRKQIFKKFGGHMRQWIFDLYRKEPVLFLEEPKIKFQKHFRINISVSSICSILHESGMSWKTIERRAIQIRDDEIVRFVKELLAIPWDLFNLVFLDEVSINNKDILRRKGYGIVGQKVVYRGEFCRKPRVSFLCFLNMNGLVDSFFTDGTFNRKKFFNCCRNFALKNSQVQRYPGFNSIWIMDGARIHCDPNIVRYLRSIGIMVIFLPAYCPFFNPIENIFGLLKRSCRRQHIDQKPVLSEICDAMNRFKTYPCSKLFNHCGYFAGGTFLPEKGLSQDPKNMDFNIFPD
ncbi:uncharacterized protein LOC129750136 [Uranotaenia lowii]|uniref:uncharacterized protein LOC129750136 n=1 Tax=Uranotaenia lowii TaxID=190385 RepID=UPI00247ABB13|nr:uncharacterized protein LOC129750136 [Uranotaenia lowii]